MADNYGVVRFKVWSQIGFGDLLRQSFPVGVLLRLLRETNDPLKLIGHPIVALLIEDPTIVLDEEDIITLNDDFPISLELISTQLDFGVNEIPTCALSLAPGRLAEDVSNLSWVHTLAEYIKNFLPMSVMMQAEKTDGSGQDWPQTADKRPKTFRIFDGYTVGSGFRASSQGSAEYSHFLTHWLSDLSFSSALTRMGSPANPLSINFDAKLNQEFDFGGGQTIKVLHEVPLTAAQTFIGDTDIVKNDIWARKGKFGTAGLKGFLEFLCSRDRFNWSDIDRLGAEFATKCPPEKEPRFRRKNTEALRALNRIEPTKADGGYRYSIPFGLKDSALSSGTVNRISLAVGPMLMRNLSGITVWDKIISSYCESFSLAVVPMVERALIVPLTPGLRKVRTIIGADEYELIDINTAVPRPIRGVGLLSERVAFGGANLSPAGSSAATAGALYDTCKDGQILIKEGPAWLVSILGPSGLNASGKSVTSNIGESGKPGAGPVAANTAADALKDDKVKTLWKEYCRSLFIKEALRHRQVRIMGRLRFDIAPGSSVAIELAEDRFVQQALGRKPDKPPLLYGTVIRVTILLDSDGQKANTVFQIGYLRSEAENQDNDYSTDSHPLWINREAEDGTCAQNWVGAPLVEDPVFGLARECQ